MSTIRTLAAALVAAMSATTSLAAVVAPVSYEVQTPNNGVYAYQDDTYNGTNVGGYLSDGTGDLTDGVIAAAHWNVTPTPWVGWSNVDPTIIFHFAAGTVLNTLDFYFDDARGVGAVSLPLGVTLSNGGGAIVVAPTITTDGIVGRYSYDIGAIATNDLTATLVRSNQWVMLSEVSFNGVNPVAGPGAVPEPATWAMMIIGFGMAGSLVRRRRTAEAA